MAAVQRALPLLICAGPTERTGLLGPLLRLVITSCLLPELARVPGLEGRGACAGRSCRGDPGDDAAGVDLA